MGRSHATQPGRATTSSGVAAVVDTSLATSYKDITLFFGNHIVHAGHIPERLHGPAHPDRRGGREWD
jgi:hypothetical protein